MWENIPSWGVFGALLSVHEIPRDKCAHCGRTDNRIRSPRLDASGLLITVDKGSRQDRSVTSGEGLALRVGCREPRASGSVAARAT